MWQRLAVVLMAGWLCGGATLLQAAEEVSYPYFGVAATPPEGWISVLEQNESEVCRWANPEGLEDARKIDSIFMIEVLPIRRGDLDTAIEDLERKFDTKASDSDVKLAGLPTKQLSAPMTDKLHDDWLIAQHGRYFIVARKRTSGLVQRDALFNRFAESVRLGEPQPPHEFLKLRAEVTPVPEAKVGFVTVAPLRRMKSPSPSQQLRFEIRNYVTNKPEYLLGVNIIRHPGELAFEEHVKNFAAGIAKANKLETPPEFQPVRCGIKAMATKLLTVPRTGKQGETEKKGQQYVVAAPTPDIILLISAEVLTTDQTLSFAYLKATLRMVATIRPLTDYLPAALQPDTPTSQPAPSP